MKDNERGIGKIGRKIIAATTSNRAVEVVSGATAVIGFGVCAAEVTYGGIHTEEGFVVWAATGLVGGISGLAFGYTLGEDRRRNRNK
jgi:hypothetical protein